MKKNKSNRIHICSLCDGLNIFEKYCHFCGFKLTIFSFSNTWQHEQYLSDAGDRKFGKFFTKYPRQDGSPLVKANQILKKIKQDIKKIQTIESMLIHIPTKETKDKIKSTCDQLIGLTQSLSQCYFSLYFKLFYNDFSNIGLYIKTKQSIDANDINEWFRHEINKYNKWKNSLESKIAGIKYDHLLGKFDSQIELIKERLSISTITKVLSTTSFITKEQIDLGISFEGNNIDNEIEKINFQMDRLFGEKELQDYLS